MYNTPITKLFLIFKAISKGTNICNVVKELLTKDLTLIGGPLSSLCVNNIVILSPIIASPMPTTPVIVNELAWLGIILFSGCYCYACGSLCTAALEGYESRVNPVGKYWIYNMGLVVKLRKHMWICNLWPSIAHGQLSPPSFGHWPANHRLSITSMEVNMSALETVPNCILQSLALLIHYTGSGLSLCKYVFINQNYRRLTSLSSSSESCQNGCSMCSMPINVVSTPLRSLVVEVLVPPVRWFG